jgi:UDP-sulfoquinovose synthase
LHFPAKSIKIRKLNHGRKGRILRVFIAGVDGYLGWSLALYLAARGHEIAGLDLYLRRDWVAEIGSQSATPEFIQTVSEQLV